jgi:hypothetical protein
MRNISLIVLSFTLGRVIYPVLGLYNFSCGCVQYTGNYGILCYPMPCTCCYGGAFTSPITFISYILWCLYSLSDFAEYLKCLVRVADT